MQPHLNEDVRPPFIQFEQRAIEDREASIKNDRLTMRDVDFVVVRQIGSVNTVEREAEDWLRDQRDKADRGVIPHRWVEFFEMRFKEYKNNLDPSVDGTAIKDWPGISRAELANCQHLNILSVEDLAGINDDTIRQLGMGGMALKQRAQAWLDMQSKSGGEELAALRAKVSDQSDTIEKLVATVDELKAELKDAKGKRRGRPPKDKAA